MLFLIANEKGLANNALAVLEYTPTIIRALRFRGRASFAPIMLADPAPEYHSDLGGLPDRTIGVEQAFTEIVQCCSASKDEVVAKFDL